MVNLGKKYAQVEDFSEGLARAEKLDGGVVFIDKNGTEVTGQYARAHSSSQGLIGAKINHGDNYGFIKNPLDVPSTWALPEVSSATSLNLVPIELDYGYKTNINRADFSKLALHLLSVKTGKTVDEMLANAGKKINYDTFEDTFDPTVLAANALGIIGGRGNNKLDPNGFITRQEAAVMLSRVSGMLGITKGTNVVTFTDEENMANWSIESIALMSSIVDNTNHAAVMGSVGNNKFGSTEHFTKQQAFITMKRLFNAK
ncbi:hypothetical protein ACVLD2_004092 [Paenibacillus sp. PvR052]|uniref:S-layer homology domain-containing protein n=1 Tax=Paenibacillus sp. PvP091 TaxID=2806590 RepID=UPI001AEB5330|nr:hypothetical protein [Paenibacillus sp. PvP052]